MKEGEAEDTDRHSTLIGSTTCCHFFEPLGFNLTLWGVKAEIFYNTMVATSTVDYTDYTRLI